MKTRAIEVHVYQNVKVVDIGGVVLPDGVDVGYACVTVLQAGQQGEAMCLRPSTKEGAEADSNEVSAKTSSFS